MEVLERMKDDAINQRPSKLFDEAVEIVSLGPWIVGLIDDRLVLKRDGDDDVTVIG